MTEAMACCHLHRAMGCCDPTDCGPCCENCPTCPTLHKGQMPGKGWCVQCGADVVVDGREGDEFGITWSHMREEVREVVVPGHHPSCEGDCRLCPVPTPDVEHYLAECGPVWPKDWRRTTDHIGPSSNTPENPPQGQL